MTYPDTSLTISLTNAVRLLKCPLVRDMRDDSRGVVFYSSEPISSHAPKLTRPTAYLHHGRQEDEKRHTWPLLRPTAIPLRCLRAIVMIDVVRREYEEVLTLGFGAKVKRRARLYWAWRR